MKWKISDNFENLILRMKFIDLFAGLGGFHLALESLGHECVFASELQADLQKLYSENFPETPIFGDITKISVNDIPAHDILCGGFPCQPFSQAWFKKWFWETRGTLFFDIVRILTETKPKFILLENVRNLASHNNGNTWNTIRKTLTEIGYLVPEKPFIVSPLNFGVPQSRERVFIPCIRKDIAKVEKIELEVPRFQSLF